VLDPAWPAALRDSAAAQVLAAQQDGRVGAGDLVLFTSGSTGRPRGVVRTAASWDASVAPLTGLTGIGPRDVVWLPGPLTSSLFLYGAWHARAVGAATVAQPAPPMEATALHAVPALLDRALEAAEAGALPRVRVAVVAGDALPEPLRARARSRGWRVVEYYGAAELSFVAWRDGAGAFRAFPGAEVAVRDGRVWVRSAYLARGYLSGDDGGPLCRDGAWASVGDLGTDAGPGRFHLLGRGDAAVTTGGHTVVVEEVERVLGAVPGVHDIAVLGLPHSRWGQVLAAVAVVDTDQDGAAVRARLVAAARRLPPAARPVRWWRAPALPRTPAGKLDRSALRAVVPGGAAVPPTLSRAMSATDPSTPVVVAARRTPVGTTGRALAHVPVHDLAAPVLRALLDDLGDPAARVDDVVLGNCTGPGGNVARVAALAAALGHEVPGVTVDRQCGSGLEAVRLAAALVGAGVAELVLAGGAESASTSPSPARAAFAPPGHPDPEMGEAADALAGLRGISRARQDAYAARSHARSHAALEAGLFAAEVVPVDGVRRDDRPRAGLDAGRLARFPAAFVPGGTVTAGNSCGVSDGAAAVAVVSEATRARLGLPGLAVRGAAVRGVDPATPGLGPVPAVEAALAQAGLALDDVELIEVTEAFAAQVLACTDALGLDPLGADAGRVCPDGGAIGLGHPWGASGALLVVRLFAAMVRRRGPRYGLATCAVGGGQGVAVVVERVG
jgi:acetyl-CoA C-acetyltransferase